MTDMSLTKVPVLLVPLDVHRASNSHAARIGTQIPSRHVLARPQNKALLLQIRHGKYIDESWWRCTGTDWCRVLVAPDESAMHPSGKSRFMRTSVIAVQI